MPRLLQLPMPVRLMFGALVFATAGPPIGGVVAWLGMGAPTLRSPIPFILGSWLEGGALALAVGLVTAAAAWFGRASWLVPVLSSALLCAAFVLATAAQDQAADQAAMLRATAVFMPPSLAAVLACWFLTRGLFRR